MKKKQTISTSLSEKRAMIEPSHRDISIVRQGHRVNRERIRRLMKKMELQSVTAGHKIYPYLLRKLRDKSPQLSVAYSYHLHKARY